VCTLTGHGLKDPDVAMRDGLKDVVRVAADRRAVEAALKQRLA
jgi:threonine synthase